ncbi:MAG: glycosyltransferase [Tannerella sp.]|jgi:glycosyltransferase involved in cell wall biosynthesis|nr:glycosyltransferase [Tannerella sp.]
MKILILCDLFPPAFGPRMGYLCKYLKQNGIEPAVVTEYIHDETFAFLTGDMHVVRVLFYKSESHANHYSKWLNLFLLEMLFGYKNRRMYREARQLTCTNRYDLILCSTYRLFPLPAACRIAKKTRLPLVVDLRDIIEQFSGNEFIGHTLPRLGGLENIIASLFRKINLMRRNRALRQAAHVTSISPWHTELLARYNPRVSLIYNGFDPDIFYPSAVKSERFYITYTGRIVSLLLRNPALLFEAAGQLADEGIIHPEKFRIRWFTDDKSRRILQREAAKYPIADFMEYHEYVPATEIPAILNGSSIVLLLANKSDDRGPKGVMTTKFFEALAVERPVLCVRGDEGCLEEVIRRTRSGLSAHNVQETRQFIEKHYCQWLATGRTAADVDRTEIEKFSRKAQAEQFIRIFDQILNANG